MERPEYIVLRNAAPFSPFAFLPDIPLTYLSLEVASVVFFVFSWLLIGVLAWCCLWMVRVRLLHGATCAGNDGCAALFEVEAVAGGSWVSVCIRETDLCHSVDSVDACQT